MTKTSTDLVSFALVQITESLKTYLNNELSNFYHEKIKIETSTKQHGGSVNYSYILETNRGSFFIKLNSASRFPNLFELENQGLKTIQETNTLRVPISIIEGSFNETAYLVLEHIELGNNSLLFWENFGQQLACLHQKKQTKFGLAYSNYIGSLTQENTFHKDWTAFFGEERILAQAKRAFDNNLIESTLLNKLEILASKLNQFFSDSSPSLLHGDLWSGNFMVGKNETPIVIDPSIYYGNREMDIAMSLLFGGFNKRFYEAYNDLYPLETNWEERVDLCNTYPLLVHVNLFGASYAQRLKGAIKRYV